MGGMWRRWWRPSRPPSCGWPAAGLRSASDRAHSSICCSKCLSSARASGADRRAGERADARHAGRRDRHRARAARTSCATRHRRTSSREHDLRLVHLCRLTVHTARRCRWRSAARARGRRNGVLPRRRRAPARPLRARRRRLRPVRRSVCAPLWLPTGPAALGHRTRVPRRARREHRLPVLLAGRGSPWPDEYVEHDAGAEQVAALRAELSERYLCGFFSTPDELAAIASAAIVRNLDLGRAPFGAQREHRLIKSWRATNALPAERVRAAQALVNMGSPRYVAAIKDRLLDASAQQDVAGIARYLDELQRLAASARADADLPRPAGARRQRQALLRGVPAWRTRAARRDIGTRCHRRAAGTCIRPRCCRAHPVGAHASVVSNK